MNAKKTTTSATAAAAAKVSKPKKAAPAKVSHAKTKAQPQLVLTPELQAPEIGMCPVDEIIVSAQVRTEFDAERIGELARDIVARGILQPLIVRKHPSKPGFHLVAGERRLRAAQMAAFKTVPVIVQTLNDEETTRAQLAENIQRQELSLADEAALLEKLRNDLDGSTSAVAALVNKSVAWVSKRIALTHKLGHYAAALLHDGITEDLELILAVSQLENLTPGTNAAWALCEKIRKGEAGRTEARDALKKAKEPKKQKDAAEPKEKKEKHPFQWLWDAANNENTTWYDYNADQLVNAALVMLPQTASQYKESLECIDNEIESLREEIGRMQEERRNQAAELAAKLLQTGINKMQFLEACEKMEEK